MTVVRHLAPGGFGGGGVPDSPATALYKEGDVWRFLRVFSNNRMDREAEIISSDAHRMLERAIDSGIYKALIGHETPLVWVWHLPVPVGTVKQLAYDERGFSIIAGQSFPGDFYDRVFTGLYNYEQENPNSLGMSHGVPVDYLRFSKDNERIIDFYLPKEVTFLPVDSAANPGTIGGTIMKDKGYSKLPLEVDERKRSWIVEWMGEDVALEFDRQLEELAASMDAAGLPSKEIDMSDELEKQEEVEEVTEPEVEAEAPEAAEEEVVEEVEEQPEAEAVKEEVASDEYVTQDDLQAFGEEVAKGISEGMAPVNDLIAELRAEVDTLRKELSERQRETERAVAEKARQTPTASIAAMIAQNMVSAVGNGATAVKESDPLFEAGPEETEAKESGVITGLKSIDDIILRQRGGRIMATTPAQPNS